MKSHTQSYARGFLANKSSNMIAWFLHYCVYSLWQPVGSRFYKMIPFSTLPRSEYLECHSKSISDMNWAIDTTAYHTTLLRYFHTETKSNQNVELKCSFHLFCLHLFLRNIKRIQFQLIRIILKLRLNVSNHLNKFLTLSIDRSAHIQWNLKLCWKGWRLQRN